MKTQTLLQNMVNNVNNGLIAAGKTCVIEMTKENKAIYFQLVTRGATAKDISKVYLTTCGHTPAKAFDWLVAFNIGANVK